MARISGGPARPSDFELALMPIDCWLAGTVSGQTSRGFSVSPPFSDIRVSYTGRDFAFDQDGIAIWGTITGISIAEFGEVWLSIEDIGIPISRFRRFVANNDNMGFLSSILSGVPRFGQAFTDLRTSQQLMQTA